MEVDNLDALIILGGNGSRYKKALKVYNEQGPLNIVCTGRYSGLDPNYSGESESIMARNYLISNNVPEDSIRIEEESLDTIANAVKSFTILKDIGANKIGVVTDDFHMDRAINTLERVLDPNYEFFPIPTGESRSKTWMLIEKITDIAQTIDLKLLDLKPGDKEKFEGYLKKEHAFHGSEPNGLYFIGTRAMCFFVKHFNKLVNKLMASN